MVSQIRTYMMRHVTTTLIWNRNNVGTHKCHGAAPRATPCCRTFLWPRPNWYRFPRPTNEHDNDLTDCRKLDLHGNWCIFSRFRGSLHGDYAIIASLTTSVCLTAHLPATPSRFSIGLRTCVTSHAVEPPNTPIVPLHKTSRSLTQAGQQLRLHSSRYVVRGLDGGWMGGISRGDCGCWGRLEVDVSLTYPGTARSNIRLTEEAVCWLRGTTAIY